MEIHSLLQRNTLCIKSVSHRGYNSKARENENKQWKGRQGKGMKTGEKPHNVQDETLACSLLKEGQLISEK